MGPNIKRYIGLFLVILIVFIINLISFKNGHDWGGDFAGYIGQAKSVVEGKIDEFISINKYRFEKSTIWIYPVLTPWGLPLLLSPVYYFFGLDIYIMKIYISLFFLPALLLLFLIFKNKLDYFQNLMLVAIVGFNPWLFGLKESILSDIPYLFFALLSLFLIQQFIVYKKFWINRHVSYVLIGSVIFFSSLIRPFGFLLLPTMLLVQYIDSKSRFESLKQFILKDNIKFLPYMVFIFLSGISKLILPPEDFFSYIKLFSMVGFSLSKFIFNLKYYFFLSARYLPYFNVEFTVYGLGYDKIHLILYIVMFFIFLLGLLSNIKKDYFYSAYVLCYMSLPIVYPPTDPRYIIPVLPFFIYFFFKGLSRITISLNFSEKYSLERINAVYLISLGLMLLSLVNTAHTAYKNIMFNKSGQVIDGPYSPDSIELFNYIKANTSKDASIIFHKPRVMILYTGRRTFAMSSYNFTPEKAYNSGADYIVINKTQYLPTNLTLDDFKGELKCEFENNSFLLCRLKKR